MEFIGLFKCNFCTSSLHDVESLITHFSIQHLNKELFECEVCCIKFWKIPDYYEHRNKKNSTCGGKYGITMKTFFNTIITSFENLLKVEDIPIELSNKSIDTSSIKSENEEHFSDINVSEELFTTFDSLRSTNKTEEIKDESTNHMENCVFSDKNSVMQNTTENISSIPQEAYTSKLRNHRKQRVQIQRKSKKIPNKNNKIHKNKKTPSENNKNIKLDALEIDSEHFKTEDLKQNGVKEIINQKCKICEEYFTNSEELRSHLKNHGKIKNEMHSCHVCNKQYNIFSSLTTHISSKHPKNLFCIQCSKQFNDQENFKRHIDDFHKIKRNGKKNEVKKLECFECTGKVFSRVSTFVMHLSNKHKKSDEEVKQILEVNDETFKNESMCKICGKLFATIDHFLKHQKKKHGIDGSKKHKCRSCPKFFVTQEEVKSHTLENHKTNLTCGICNNGKIYACTESLTSHIRKIHNSKTIENENGDINLTAKCKKVYKFVCGLCGKVMYGRTQFKNHEASNCGKNPVHKCHICGKGFASAGTLKGHVSIHEDYESYEFVCDFCRKRYRTKHQLKKHRRIHTGERPFQCPHCEKAFGTSAALFVHISTHTGVKRYMCTCGERFSCITGLKGHWKTNSSTCGSDPNKSTKPVGEYIGYRKGKVVNIRPEEEMMMRPSL